MFLESDFSLEADLPPMVTPLDFTRYVLGYFCDLYKSWSIVLMYLPKTLVFSLLILVFFLTIEVLIDLTVTL